MLRLSYIVWSLKIAWQTNALLTSVYFVSALLRGIIPIILVIAIRFLINDVVLFLDQDVLHVESVFLWLGIMGFFTIIDLIALLVGSRYVPKRLEDDLHTTIASTVMEHAYQLPLHLFEDQAFQDTLERAQQNLAINFIMFFRSLVEAMTGILQVLSLFAVLVFVEPLMVVIAMISMPTYAVIMRMISQQRYENEYKRAPDRRWTRYFTELMLTRDYATEVRMLGIGELIINRFRKIMDRIKEENAFVERRALIVSMLFALITITLFYSIFARVIFRVLDKSLTPGDIAILGGAIARLSTSAENIVARLGLAIERSLHIGNLQQYLAIPTQAEFNPEAPLPDDLSGLIQFKDVSFTYPDTDNQVLSDISFSIHPGETVAIVGANGAGKSTLVKLLARIYEPDTGNIIMGGVPLNEIPQQMIFEQVAFVLQNFGQYEATTADNIAYGNPADYLNQNEKIRVLAQELDIHDMIESLPEGYDTFLGRRFGAYDLSRGQWQQLAIARAFAKNSPILILDEPTASFDAQTEHDIFSRFVKLVEERTTLLISHRFTTVSMADRIIVLSEGKIIEQGSHDDLMMIPNGLYAHLYQLQHGKL